MTVPRLQNLAPGGAAGAAVEVGTKEGARARTITLGDNGRRRVKETRGSSRCARPPLATGGSKKSGEGQPGGRWAQPPPLKGPRRPRRPLPPGPAQRPGR